MSGSEGEHSVTVDGTSVGEAVRVEERLSFDGWVKLIRAVLPFFKRSEEEQARARKLSLEIQVLERQLGIGRTAKVPLHVGLLGLNALNLVVGGQHTGKSFLMGAAARLALAQNYPTYWWEPSGTEKEHQPEGCHWFTPGKSLPNNARVFIDEAWELFETVDGRRSAAQDTKWLRTLYHGERKVWMATQSGGFLSPRVWKSGAVAVYCTGTDGVGERFDREEVMDIVSVLARHALPKRIVSAFSGGAFYEMDWSVA